MPSRVLITEGATSTDAAPPRTLEIESRSFEYVPASARFGTIPDQRKFWFMINATIVTVFAGTVGPLFGLGLGWTLAAIVLGSLVGTVFQALHAAQGPVMGLPQMIQSRVQFGSRGALLPLVAAVIVLAGFPLFSMQTGASALNTIAPIDFDVAQIIIATLAAVVAVFGYKLVLRSEKVMAYISCAIFLLITIAIIFIVPWGDAFSGGWNFNITAFLAQCGASAMLQLGIAPFVSDFTRYLPRTTSKWAITAAVFGGTALSAVWISCLGAVVATSFPDMDPIVAIQQIGDQTGFALGTILLVVTVPAAVLTISSGLYSATVSLLTGVEAFRSFSTTKLLRLLVIAGLTAIIVTAGLILPDDVASNFGYFLTVMGYLLVPWTAINLVDFYLIRREIYSITDIVRSDGGMYGKWAADGLLSYAVGFIVMIPFFSTPFYTGPIAAALGGADIAFVIGLAASSATYLILNRKLNRGAYLERVSTAPINTLPITIIHP